MKFSTIYPFLKKNKFSDKEFFIASFGMREIKNYEMVKLTNKNRKTNHIDIDYEGGKLV